MFWKLLTSTNVLTEMLCPFPVTVLQNGNEDPFFKLCEGYHILCNCCDATEGVFVCTGGIGILSSSKRRSTVYRAVNSSIIGEFTSPHVWFAFRADADGGALQAVFAALSAHICICGEIKQYTWNSDQST